MRGWRGFGYGLVDDDDTATDIQALCCSMLGVKTQLELFTGQGNHGLGSGQRESGGFLDGLFFCCQGQFYYVLGVPSRHAYYE